MTTELKTIATGAELTADTFNDFVQRLRHHVQGEGVRWHHTADALFTVQARRIIFGIDRDYTDKVAVTIEDAMYFSPQEYWDYADEEQREHLDQTSRDTHDVDFLSLDEREQWDILGELDDHTVSGWDESWEYVNSHFTKEAAEAFIARKKHDYRHGMRVYVDAQVYCWEFNAIIKGLLDGRIAFSAPPSAQTVAQEREAFEKWWKARHQEFNFHGAAPSSGWYYFDDDTDTAWQAWQARAALAAPAQLNDEEIMDWARSYGMDMGDCFEFSEEAIINMTRALLSAAQEREANYQAMADAVNSIDGWSGFTADDCKQLLSAMLAASQQEGG